jgi:hypothetical protein
MPLRTLRLVLLFFLPLNASAAPRDTSSQPAIVFSHVNVISMRSDAVLTDQTVLIRGSKIIKIAPAGTFAIPADSFQIDGTGKYLMPGLADLHVHLFSSADLLPYVAHGVTTVLNMSGSPMHIAWRNQVRAGQLLGPAIYTATPTIDGFPPLNETFVTEEDPQQAQDFIHECKLAGYDFIKLYGTLRPDVFRSILDAAARESIPVVGHVNRQVGALEVLKTHQVLAAHLEDLLFSRFDQPPSDAELQDFANAIAASHITVTPNLNVNPANIAQLQDLDNVLKSSESQLLSPAAYSQWMPANNRNERNDQSAQQIEQMNQIQKILYCFVALLRDRHVPLVLGTDAAAYGFPGLSAHQELQELVAAGFSPYQALLTATRNSGDFLAENIPAAPRFGAVSEGFAADLLLLSANPLADIRNLRSMEGVLLHGRWLPASELQNLQSAARRRADPIKQQLREIDSALEAGNVAAAQKSAQPLQSERDPWVAEWVLLTKARKSQTANLPAAIQIARWNAQLYPDSFFAHYLLADLLFQDNQLAAAVTAIHKSQTLEPHNAAAINLSDKMKALRQPLRFTPQGTYHVQLKNDQTGETQTAEFVLDPPTGGHFAGKKRESGNDAGPLRSVSLGGNRLWVTMDGAFGSLELRLTVEGDSLSGYWAGPFGHNGQLAGKKLSNAI